MDAFFGYVVGMIVLRIVVESDDLDPVIVKPILQLNDEPYHVAALVSVSDSPPGAITQAAS